MMASIMGHKVYIVAKNLVWKSIWKKRPYRFPKKLSNNELR
jgi:hypothetical protein